MPVYSINTDLLDFTSDDSNSSDNVDSEEDDELPEGENASGAPDQAQAVVDNNQTEAANPPSVATPGKVDPNEKRLAIILDINYRCLECLKYYGNLCIPAILKCGHHVCSTCLANIEKEADPPRCKECTLDGVTNNVVSLKTEDHTLKKLCEEYSQLQSDPTTVKNEYISYFFEKIYKMEVDSILSAKDDLKTFKLLHASKIEHFHKFFTKLATEIEKMTKNWNKFYTGVPGSVNIEAVTKQIQEYEKTQKSSIKWILDSFELCKFLKPRITFDKITDFVFTKKKIEAGVIPREIVAVMEKGDSRIYYKVTTDKGTVFLHCAEECPLSPHAIVIDYESLKDRKKYDNSGFFLRIATVDEIVELRFHFQLECLFNLQIAKLCVGESGHSYKGSHVRLTDDALVVPEYRPIDKKRAEDVIYRKASDIIHGIPDMIKGAKCQVGSVYTMRCAGIGAQLYISTTNANRNYCVASLTNSKQLFKIQNYSKIIDCGIILIPKQ